MKRRYKVILTLDLREGADIHEVVSAISREAGYECEELDWEIAPVKNNKES